MRRFFPILGASLLFIGIPAPAQDASKIVDQYIKAAGGAKSLARIQTLSIEGTLAGGVLANLQKGTSFVIEQAFINNEVWLPTYEEAHVGVRLLMLKGFKVNQVTRYSDYKRFDVQSLATIGKPKEAAENPAPRRPNGRRGAIVRWPLNPRRRFRSESSG